MKIGRAAQKKEPDHPVRRAISTAIIAGAGTGAGMALGHGLGTYLTRHGPTERGAQLSKIILPILGGAAVVLGNELRKMKDEGYRGALGSKERS